MKQIVSLMLAGLVGGLFAFGLITYFGPENPGSDPIAYPIERTKQVNVAPNLPDATIDFRTAAQKAMPAVVHINARESKEKAMNRGQQQDPFFRFFGETPFGDLYAPREGTGSGVIYTEDGYIITNNHVIEFADEIEVTLFDNRKFKAKVVGTYPKTDLAVLKIEAAELPTLEIGDSDQAEIGEWVLAVGNPLNLTSTVTAGIVSAKGRDINIIQGADAIESFIQTDAAVNPGNSGGALVDAQGRLLGINTAISTQTGYFQGYSFAIPVNIVTKIADDIIEYGSFQRAFLGVRITPLDASYAKELGVKITQGVVIESVEDGSSAQYAGLLPRDIIVGVDGREVKSIPELQEVVGRARVGDTMTLTIIRDEQEQEFPVALRGQ
jgi:serine protease Do